MTKWINFQKVCPYSISSFYSHTSTNISRQENTTLMAPNDFLKMLLSSIKHIAFPWVPPVYSQLYAFQHSCASSFLDLQLCPPANLPSICRRTGARVSEASFQTGVHCLPEQHAHSQLQSQLLLQFLKYVWMIITAQVPTRFAGKSEAALLQH